MQAGTFELIIAHTCLFLSYSAETRELLESSTSKALVPYGSLAELSRSVKATLGGNNTKLEAFLTASVESLLQELKTSLAK